MCCSRELHKIENHGATALHQPIIMVSDTNVEGCPIQMACSLPWYTSFESLQIANDHSLFAILLSATENSKKRRAPSILRGFFLVSAVRQLDEINKERYSTLINIDFSIQLHKKRDFLVLLLFTSGAASIVAEAPLWYSCTVLRCVVYLRSSSTSTK